MKTFFLLFFFVVLTCRISVLAQKKDGYTLVRQDRNISVYEKWMTYPTKAGPVQSRELKCEFFYKNTIYAGLHLLQNEKRMMDWQSHVAECRIYIQRDTATWQEYSYHDIPWPVNDQDHYMEFRAALKQPGVMVINFKSKVNASIAPERKGVTRLELVGSWTLEQVTPQMVKATYKVLSKPLDIPKIFVDPIIRGNMVTTMAEFVTILESKEQL